MIKLFIDDVRMPEDVGYKNSDFLIARDPFKARRMIDQFKPQFIAFDHDLGEDEYGKIHRTGHDIAKWMVDQDNWGNCDYITEIFTFGVHSANPVGAKNIENVLNDYMKYKFGKG